MAKDPAFLFYSQDFFTGVATLNWEERGKFISILCLMHQQGRMSEETIRFLVGSVSDNLKSKFKIDEKGLWYNERLEIEARKRSEFTESRRQNGNLGGRPKKDKANGKPNQNHKVMHMGNHMGNENVNEDVFEINRVEGVKNFITIIPKVIGSRKYRIWGVEGLKELYQMQMSAIPYPEHAEKFMQRNTGKPFEDFKHVFNSFNKFVEKQYQ